MPIEPESVLMSTGGPRSRGPAGKVDIAFLINPVSGGGVGKRVFHQLPEIMASFGFAPGSWRAELTEAGRLEAQTDGLLDSARRVIAVGGDGTIGFVLSRLRLRDLGDIEIGLIPLGTGNDLGRALGIFRIYNERGLLACVKRLLKAQGTRFDLWDINGRLTMASYVSLGMDAAVLHDFDVARKAGKIPTGSLYNKLYYVKAFLARSASRISAHCSLVLETDAGEQRIELDGSLCCVVANINSYAAGARLFPSARFDDGLLEVAVFDRLWKFSSLVSVTHAVPRFAKLIGPHIRLYQAHSVGILGGKGEFCQLDGEDITAYLAEAGGLRIRPSRQVQLLDLRRESFSLF
jgi:diacylglycerol kinase family enzyme